MRQTLYESSTKSPFSLLVVDDHPAVADAVARVVAMKDVDVMVASSLEDARSRADHRAPDVVIAGLEGKNGFQLLVELVAMPSAPGVIVHAESLDAPAAQWAKAHAIEEVVEKPAPPQLLARWAARLLQRRSASVTEPAASFGGSAGREGGSLPESSDWRISSPNGSTEPEAGGLSLEGDEPAPSSAWRTSVPPSSGTAFVGRQGLFESLPSLEEFIISDVFRECEGNLSMAARTLGIPRSTLRDRLRKYGITLPAGAKQKGG